MAVNRLPNIEGGIQPTLFTTKGDLISATASSTVARLPVGTDAQILVADSTTATGLKWATAASGSGLTLISTQTAAGVASLTFDSVFSSTYLNYLLVFNGVRSTSGATTADLYLQYRYSGTTETTQYKYGITGVNTAGTAITVGATGASQGILVRNLGDATYKQSGFLFINQVGNASEMALGTGQAIDTWGEEMNNVSVYCATARTYTGFIISTSSGNINGTFSIYGLAK